MNVNVTSQEAACHTCPGQDAPNSAAEFAYENCYCQSRDIQWVDLGHAAATLDMPLVAWPRQTSSSTISKEIIAR